MSRVLDEVWKEGYREGYRKSYRKGCNKVRKEMMDLICMMLDQNRYNNIHRALSDKRYYRILLAECKVRKIFKRIKK